MEKLYTIEVLQKIPDEEFFAIVRWKIQTKLVAYNRQYALVTI